MSEKEGKIEVKEVDGPVTVIMKLDMHCLGCAHKLKNNVKKFNGVEKVSTDVGNDTLMVIGRVDPLKIREYVESKTRKNVDLISPTITPEDSAPISPEEDSAPIPPEEDSTPKNAESKETKGEEEDVVIEPMPPAVEVNNTEYCGRREYNEAHSPPYREEMEHATHLFSDANPNACMVSERRSNHASIALQYVQCFVNVEDENL